ncbi:MAG: type IV secretion system DNA-binding domain-containing protein [Candidatus Komeilibacteria bacterium]
MLDPNYTQAVVTTSQIGWFIFVTALLLFIVVVFWWWRRHLRLHHIVPSEWKHDVLELTVPKLRRKDGQDEKVDNTHELVSLAENLFSTVGGLQVQSGWQAWLYGRQDTFAFEIVVQGGIIYFYVSVPRTNREFLEQQLNSIYPHINIMPVEDYNIFQPKGEVAAAAMQLQREYIFPIKTYKQLENDPLGIITSSLSKITDKEGAAVQLVLRSSHRRWHRRGTEVASLVQQGKSISEAMKNVGFGSWFGKLLDIIINLIKSAGSGQENKTPEPAHQLTPQEQEMIKGIEQKSSKAGLDANLRVVVSAQNQALAQQKLNDIIHAYSQFNIYQYGNGFKAWQPRRQAKKDSLIEDFIYRNYVQSRAMVLNTEEVVSLWHLPLPTNETPNIKWLKARQAAPPVDLPTDGLLLGMSKYRGVEREVRIRRSDRRRHIYVIGQTGTGKSTFLKHMTAQDIANGEGCCVIDPHGDFAIDMLAQIPPERADDVIYFNPFDVERPLALNMLEHNTPEQKTFVVNELLSIFDKLYDLKSTGGPMFEMYMRNALLLIMDDPQSGMTLMEVPRILADQEFRNYKLNKCKTQSVIDFWRKEAEKAGGEAALANIVPYITSKLTPFIANDIMRPIIAQQKSSFDFRDIMDNKKILICNLSKGKLGEINSNLLGMVVVGKILLAALSRVDLGEQERSDFYMYIDEFQNFTTDSIAIILSEARKYRLNLNIAHQYIGQLVKHNDTTIRDAVFGNVGTTVAFRIGVDDAETITKQFAPVFDEYDVVNVPARTAYIKLMVDNANPPAFSISTIREPQGDKKIAAKVIELSRQKYGRPRADIEKEILQRSQNAGQPDWLDQSQNSPTGD